MRDYFLIHISNYLLVVELRRDGHDIGCHQEHPSTRATEYPSNRNSHICSLAHLHNSLTHERPSLCSLDMLTRSHLCCTFTRLISHSLTLNHAAMSVFDVLFVAVLDQYKWDFFPTLPSFTVLFIYPLFLCERGLPVYQRHHNPLPLPCERSAKLKLKPHGSILNLRNQ